MRQKVLLSSASLAEGGISAAFQALSGASISDVAKAARESLLPKQDQLQDNARAEERTTTAPIPPGHEILDVTIENEYGLHLRPAPTLIKTLAGYPGEVLIENRSGGRGPVTAKAW
jgi:PTS HPr component family protein